MRESRFQAHLISTLKETFEGCIVLKNDANYIQGIPDLIILWRNKWAALEVKSRPDASLQPNQLWYIEQMDEMSYAAVVYPENLEVVINELQQTFRSRR